MLWRRVNKLWSEKRLGIKAAEDGAEEPRAPHRQRRDQQNSGVVVVHSFRQRQRQRQQLEDERQVQRHLQRQR